MKNSAHRQRERCSGCRGCRTGYFGNRELRPKASVEGAKCRFRSDHDASLTTAVVAVGLLAAPPIFAQTGQPGHAAATSAKDALDQEDKTFVREAAIGGMAEAELSKIAQKSENGDVKRFADRMIADHTKANEQLTSIATGLGVDLPKILDSQH
jgi:hypothetical protein